MSGSHPHNYPKLHNAMWPGLVGKGSPGAEPTIDLDTMLDLTAAAEVDGIKFDGVDLFLYEPHVNIDIGKEDLKAVADKIAARGFVVGSVVAPVWFDASAMGDEAQRTNYLAAIEKACGIAQALREMGMRPNGVVRIDTAAPVAEWAKVPAGNQAKIAETFKQAAKIARNHGERLAAEGEICWGGMHSWRTMVDLLERVGEPDTVGFQADMAHTLLYTLGENSPEDRILPEGYDWKDGATLDAALKTLTASLRPGRSTSTSPRTTRPSSARARTTTPGVTAWRLIPTESSTSRIMRASGFATRTGSSRRRPVTFAGTVACSPMTS